MSIIHLVHVCSKIRRKNNTTFNKKMDENYMRASNSERINPYMKILDLEEEKNLSK